MRLILILSVLTLSSCRFNPKFEISNFSDSDINEAGISSSCHGYFPHEYLAISAGESRLMNLDMSEASEGHYILCYSKSEVEIECFNFGYFTNGPILREFWSIGIYNDTLIFNSN